MTSPPNTHSKPTPPVKGNCYPEKTLYYYTNCLTIIPNYNIYCYRTNYVLHPIRSDTHTYTNHYHPMRQPNRTPERRPVLPILHSSRLPASPNRLTMDPRQFRHFKSSSNPIPGTTSARFVIQYPVMTGMHNGIYSKNALVWPSSMTPKSSRRSSYRRVHSSRRSTTQIRGIRYNTNYRPTKSIDKFNSVSFHDAIHMRNNYNKLYLFTPNGLKILNCLLLGKPHSPSNCSGTHSITMKLHRSNSPDNCSWPYIIHTVLSSQLQL